MKQSYILRVYLELRFIPFPTAICSWSMRQRCLLFTAALYDTPLGLGLAQTYDTIE